jgi:hypothetical protein
MFPRVISCCVVLATVVLAASSARASILGSQSLEIDFTKPDEAARKVTWSDPEHLTCTERGFGLDAEENACRDGWLQTIPVGIGTSWRPAGAAHLRVTLKPARRKVTLPNGQSYEPGGPRLYARHSPDAVHWSDWQPLTHDRDASVKAGAMIHQGEVGTPARNREAYDRYREEYRKLDVPWVDDEEAMCVWIVKRDPDFFSKHKPFVGYVQFLMEDCFPGGQRIESLSATMTWGVGGMHQPPKDPQGDRKQSSMDGWQFRGEAAQETGGLMDFEFDRQVPPTEERVELSAAARVVRTKQGLALRVKIANASAREIDTKLAHEWHGGEWPPTALYTSVTAASSRKSEPFVPIYLIGEDQQAARSVTIAPGKTKEVELRMDWPGTGSVPTSPFIREPGKYSVRFALVFEAGGKQQYVMTAPQAIDLAPD